MTLKQSVIFLGLGYWSYIAISPLLRYETSGPADVVFSGEVCLSQNVELFEDIYSTLTGRIISCI